MRTAHSLGNHTAETTFYTPFANLLNTIGERLKPRVHFQAHPGSHGAGLADGGLFPLSRSSQREPLPGQLPERGAVEIKAPGANLATLKQSAQVRRYLETYGLCLITNYHQFQLLELLHNQPHTLESYDLTPTADALWHLPLTDLVTQHTETLPDFLLRVMTRKVPLEKPKDVAWLLASYAREARARAATHPLAAFDGVKSALQESLGITFEGEKGEHFFLSTLIQTLFYGIFSAWVLWRRTPEARTPHAVFNWRLSADYLRIPVLRALFHAVSERGALNTVQIMEVLDHATDALNRVQPGFFATFNDEDAVNYFYEPFLQAFDPELRKQLGVWYTPREIVRYMVERVDHLLRTELHEPLGLASPNVQVLDPCCGTGAYLVEVLHRIERTLREQAGDDNALIGADLRRAATTRIFGFEIMPAPFVIAHLQLANLLEKAGASLTADQRAQVFLTNALTGWVPARHPQSNFGFPAFTAERDAAEAIKQADTILVILGNPPYNGYAGIAQIEEERGLTTAYRTPVPGLTAPQGQGLNDLYVRFFRIAERRIVGDANARGNRNGRGLVSFISNNAWLDGLSHTSMRARYLEVFQSIYIDNLNGDKYRTGKTTPDGKPDPSAFSTPQNREGIQVGTAIATLVRNGTHPGPDLTGPNRTDATLTILATQPSANGAILYQPEAQPQVSGPPVVTRAEGPTHIAPQLHLRNVWGSTKLSHLDREAKRETEPSYDAINPAPALGLPFADRIHSAAYTSWPRLTELFPITFPGIKTSRDPLLVNIDRTRLSQRMDYYLDPRNTDEAVRLEIPISMTSASRFDAVETRHTLLQIDATAFQQVFEGDASVTREGVRHDLIESRIQAYYYRPFDLRWLYWELHTKLLDEKREDYFRAHVPGSLAMLSAQSNRRAFDAPCVTRSLASLHVIERTALAIPLRASLPNLFHSNVLQENIPENFNERYPISQNHEDIFFHALATMHTPRYQTENSGALLGDWPRIPLPSTAERLTYSAALGRRLADLLDPESDIQLHAEWSFLARLSIPPEFTAGTPEENDRRNAARFALTAGWGGAGQGATVMPRRGKSPERDWTAHELERLTALAATQSLTLDQVLALLGSRCVDVYLNDTSLWAAVPLNVWHYTLGGYQVLKKWLSYRELPLLGRPLHEDEARYFAQVVRRIAAILLLSPALDASYAAILPDATGLPA